MFAKLVFRALKVRYFLFSTFYADLPMGTLSSVSRIMDTDKLPKFRCLTTTQHSKFLEQETFKEPSDKIS